MLRVITVLPILPPRFNARIYSCETIPIPVLHSFFTTLHTWKHVVSDPILNLSFDVPPHDIVSLLLVHDCRLFFCDMHAILAMAMLLADVLGKDRSVCTKVDASALHSLLRYTTEVFTLTVLLIIFTWRRFILDEFIA